VVITISGNPGAGKTTLGKMLAKELNYEFFSGGDLRGKYAQSLNKTIDELNDLCKEKPEYHTKCDKYQKVIAENNPNIVIESWLGWYFVKNSINIFISVDPRVGAERIYNEMKTNSKYRKDEKVYNSIDDCQKQLAKRVKVSREQFIELYGKKADFLKLKNYNIIVDSTKFPLNKVYQKIKDDLFPLLNLNKPSQDYIALE
jgi:CMP/dCMP kinase